MQIKSHRRLGLFAGPLLLALIVIATGVQAAQARTDGARAQPGTVSLATPTQPRPSTALPPHATGGRTVPAVSPALSGSSGASVRNAWIVAGLAAAALIIVAAWILARRRRQPGGRPSAAYCAQHPEDPLCTTT